MYHEQDANWAKVTLHKYCLGLKAKSNNPDILPSSPNWKAIKIGSPFSLMVCDGQLEMVQGSGYGQTIG